MSAFLDRMSAEELSANGSFLDSRDWNRDSLTSRHAMLVDQKTEGVVVPLNVSLKSEGRIELANSVCQSFCP